MGSMSIMKSMDCSYQSYVAAQSERNPCLLGLCNFLAGPDSTFNRNHCRIASLDFLAGRDEPIPQDVDISRLRSVVEDNFCTSANKLLGRVLIVEDLSGDVVEILGSCLDIDPLFFASHIHAAYVDITAQTPDQATLPSRMRPQKFTNIHYHRTITVQNPSDFAKRQLRNMNVGRKIKILPPTRDTHIGLVQHCCSVLKSPQKGKGWLCVILVDPLIKDNRLPVRDERQEVAPSSLPCRLFLGGFEDFLEPPSFFEEKQAHAPTRQGLWEDLMYYWERAQPECFDAEGPTLASLSYYPLKIIAAEWMSYVAMMSYSIKRYEYTVEDLPGLFQELGKLNSDLRGLQSWRRRSIQSRHKISCVGRFLNAHHAKIAGGLPEDLSLLADDYEHIGASIDSYSDRLESMLPVVTSLVQIVDSRRSFAETANVSRLTYLALVFVPLTFTTGLFSMNVDKAPGGHNFWIYFAVAIPVTVTVFMLARPPSKQISWLREHIASPSKNSQSPV